MIRGIAIDVGLAARAGISLTLLLTLGCVAHAQGCTVSGTAGELVYNDGSGGCLSSSATVTSGGMLTLGGDLTNTGNVNLYPASSNNVFITADGTSNRISFKAGPGCGGAVLFVLGNGSNDIEPQTDIALPGGTWGTGTLANNLAPIYQNASFSGSTTNAQSAFGAFLQQTDNSSNT